ncbi:sensor histidine kinase DpiB [Providencia stuartii]|uniref:histidine kinase n=2 Tax=Providencia TaxID=586 RepID=A0AAI9D9V2_PROST|nr:MULTISPECIES: sensor histidine kinase DpiB [Providencia]ELR5111666.1 sensor histidine kinase DpiB [Providencia stuartii]ELR5299144.1 sensor histidine kinase DpiB [Providencia stuartii]MDW7587402.1 sensor histidine kinase DpiB [Providencia sp. 2023EL-00965]MDX4947214.1 sensor histidine kinase DpiB [Providencia manganoxydans]QQO61103.1 sensor histidine kinase DpiB [Providencia manganoxydans]
MKKEYLHFPLRKHKSISFSARVFLLLLLVSIVLTLGLGKYFTDTAENRLMANIRSLAMSQAKLIASIESIVQSVKTRDIQKLKVIADKLNQDSDYDYVVIGDENSMRLYHPNQDKVGFKMQWNKPGALERGESYFIGGEGSIGNAVRAKTPIFDEQGTVIGVVSIGYLTKNIETSRSELFVQTGATFFGVLVILLFLSWAFSRLIQRQMLGLEPEQITQMVVVQKGIFEAVFEGVIAVDCTGRIININHNARQMLALSEPPNHLIGRSVSELITPATFFVHDIAVTQHDVICVFNGLNVIANRIALQDDNHLMGAVISFRSQNDIESLNAQLTQVRQYVENLRSLRHEHLNWMSTLSGLLQMKEYDQALAMIKGESESQQQLIDALRKQFFDKQVAGLLFGKYHRARELGLQLEFTPGCQLNSLPQQLTSTEFCAILGNLLDNAFEATLKNNRGNKQIELYLSDESAEFVIEIADQGCGFPSDMKEKWLERGMTTKTESVDGHGIGLYLVASYVKRCNGVIIIEDNQPHGTLFSIFIPKVKIQND